MLRGNVQYTQYARAHAVTLGCRYYFFLCLCGEREADAQRAASFIQVISSLLLWKAFTTLYHNYTIVTREPMPEVSIPLVL